MGLNINLSQQIIMKRKMQSVNFESVHEFLDYITEDELKIVEFLRNLIAESLPEVKEKLSFNVPFFYRKRNICFIWPASIKWGNVNQNGVSLGFTQGDKLSNVEGYFEQKDRKRVISKTFFSIQEIDVDLVKTSLFEAFELDINS